MRGSFGRAITPTLSYDATRLRCFFTSGHLPRCPSQAINEGRRCISCSLARRRGQAGADRAAVSIDAKLRMATGLALMGQVRRKAAATALRAPRPEWVDVCFLSPTAAELQTSSNRRLGPEHEVAALQPAAREQERRGRKPVERTALAGAARGDTASVLVGTLRKGWSQQVCRLAGIAQRRLDSCIHNYIHRFCFIPACHGNKDKSDSTEPKDPKDPIHKSECHLKIPHYKFSFDASAVHLRLPVTGTSRPHESHRIAGNLSTICRNVYMSPIAVSAQL